MSDLKQIHSALDRLFRDDGKRIVFWNDPGRRVFGLASHTSSSMT